ncbi:MAG: glycosyltransferase family 2 protein [Phycisphaerales bacterium]
MSQRDITPISERTARPLPPDERIAECVERYDPSRPPAEGGEWPEKGSVPVTLLVPVLNEQRNLPGCLRRMQWASELTVIDSDASTDLTVPIAQAFGAKVYRFQYDRERGWPKKRNWSLDNVPWENEWILILDADEYMTPELAWEIKAAVEGTWTPQGKPAEVGTGDAYWINRKFMFMGRWIKGCGYYPSWNIRLFKHWAGRYERLDQLGDTGSGDNEVHEHIVLKQGKAGFLKHDFLHYAYPDLTVWVEKHNRYSTWEALSELNDAKGEIKPKLFGKPVERRRWFKKYSRNLPMRPSLRFLYSYVLQKGFLDGYPGFMMCRLLGWYELISIAKREDIKIKEKIGDQMPD